MYLFVSWITVQCSENSNSQSFNYWAWGKGNFFVDDFNVDLIIGNCETQGPMFCLCYASHHDNNHDVILWEIRLIFEPTVCQYWRLLVILVATIDGSSPLSQGFAVWSQPTPVNVGKAGGQDQAQVVTLLFVMGIGLGGHGRGWVRAASAGRRLWGWRCFLLWAW